MNDSRQSLPTVLVTGFEPYDDLINASGTLIASLRDNPPEALRRLPAAVHFRLLPVDTERIETLLEGLLHELRPDVCIFTGQAPGRAGLTFERVAVNLRDFSKPDAQGRTIQDEPVTSDGPMAYRSTLPAQGRAIEVLNAAGIHAAWSNHAGNHLCNQLLYLALHRTRFPDSSTTCSFLHVPALPDQVLRTFPDAPSMSLETLRNGLGIILEQVIGTTCDESAS